MVHKRIIRSITFGITHPESAPFSSPLLLYLHKCMCTENVLRGQFENLFGFEHCSYRCKEIGSYLIRVHGDDGTESKDEWVDVLHVEVIGGHSIRHRVVCQNLYYHRRTCFIILLGALQIYIPRIIKQSPHSIPTCKFPLFFLWK